VSGIEGAQVPIGAAVVDGEDVEFVWAPGTGFVTAQFVSKSPRGIANITGLDGERAHVVPLAHRAWLDRSREAALVDAGRAYFRKATEARGAGESRGSPALDGADWVGYRNSVAPGLFNSRRGLTTRTR
jgi:hypothetical protein